MKIEEFPNGECDNLFVFFHQFFFFFFIFALFILKILFANHGHSLLLARLGGNPTIEVSFIDAPRQTRNIKHLTGGKRGRESVS